MRFARLRKRRAQMLVACPREADQGTGRPGDRPRPSACEHEWHCQTGIRRHSKRCSLSTSLTKCWRELWHSAHSLWQCAKSETTLLEYAAPRGNEGPQNKAGTSGRGNRPAKWSDSDSNHANRGSQCKEWPDFRRGVPSALLFALDSPS
jgi:hypothetical protein